MAKVYVKEVVSLEVCSEEVMSSHNMPLRLLVPLLEVIAFVCHWDGNFGSIHTAVKRFLVVSSSLQCAAFGGAKVYIKAVVSLEMCSEAVMSSHNMSLGLLVPLLEVIAFICHWAGYFGSLDAAAAGFLVVSASLQCAAFGRAEVDIEYFILTWLPRGIGNYRNVAASPGTRLNLPRHGREGAVGRNGVSDRLWRPTNEFIALISPYRWHIWSLQNIIGATYERGKRQRGDTLSIGIVYGEHSIVRGLHLHHILQLTTRLGVDTPCPYAELAIVGQCAERIGAIVRQAAFQHTEELPRHVPRVAFCLSDT